MNTFTSIFLTFTLLASAVHAESSYNLAPTNYSTAKDNNTISRLQDAIDEQKRTLPNAAPNIILKALLAELDIPVSSQTLVFSKTSLQRKLISPQNPRALYFNDDIYIGYVPGGNIEVIAADDPTGIMFYEFDLSEASTKRKFARTSECLTCHDTSRTQHIPGLFVRSVFPDETGLPILSWGDFDTTPASPITQRWGGWFVTGQSDPSGHMGNKWVKEGRNINTTQNINVKDLAAYTDTTKYLTNTSDILALMLLEHQTKIHNTLSAAKITFNRRTYLANVTNPDFKFTDPTTQKVIQRHTLDILKDLLFADEFHLPGDGINGSEAFVKDFMAKAKTYDDHSLRDLRLQKRIFKYRCSYMIHSHAFKTLPEPIKTNTLKTLYKLLTTDLEIEGLPTLSTREKTRIHAILTHTHQDYKTTNNL